MSERESTLLGLFFSFVRVEIDNIQGSVCLEPLSVYHKQKIELKTILKFPFV